MMVGGMDRPRKIAVLGGGAGALSAVYALTSEPDWRQRYEITVYQVGWRLGGKGASSRDPETRHRNEEHGLHVIGGYYHNFFRLIRDCYSDWQTVGELPSGFDEAFWPLNRFTLEEENALGWRHVHMKMPANHKEPGRGATEKSIRVGARDLTKWVSRQLLRFQALAADGDPEVASAQDDAERVSVLLEQEPITHERWSEISDGLADALLPVLKRLRDLLLRIEARWTPKGTEPNPLALAAIAVIYVIGLISDCRTSNGFESINDYDLLEWIRQHGANDRLINSPYARSGYDYAFAYKDGAACPSDRAIAAGVALRATLKMLLTYHGALFWHMDGGMGEIVFVPLFEVLRARGVNFKFFRRVESIVASADGTYVERIVGARQSVAEVYDPLIRVGHRLCFPKYPRYDQLPDGPRLEAENDDLESWWSPERHCPKFELRRGADFDDVILGISVGALAALTPSLANSSLRWRAMLDSSHVVPTAHVQVWSSRTTKQLGGSRPNALVTAYAQPLNTWADMSFLLKHETTSGKLRHLSYLCGPLERVEPVPDAPGSPFPIEQQKRVRRLSDLWLSQSIGHLLPKAVDPVTGVPRPEFSVEVYTRANVNPSDCYVLSLPGTISKRVTVGETGFANLFPAGDWTRNGLNAGAVEAAVTSGLQCARALGANPVITGERSFL